MDWQDYTKAAGTNASRNAVADRTADYQQSLGLAEPSNYQSNVGADDGKTSA